MTRTQTADQSCGDQRPDRLLDLTPREVRQPLGYSVASLSAETELSKQTLYREIDAGRLKAKRVRGRLVIPAEAVAAWLNADTEEPA